MQGSILIPDAEKSIGHEAHEDGTKEHKEGCFLCGSTRRTKNSRGGAASHAQKAADLLLAYQAEPHGALPRSPVRNLAVNAL